MSTAKERQAKRRARIRADSELHQAQLLRDRERKKCQRKAQKEKMSEHQLEEHRLKERLRIKAYRSKQSMKPTSSTASTTDLGTPYRSRQALGKANLHVSNILLLENLLDLSDYLFHHHLRKASLQKVKQKENWCILFTELMMYHGKLLEGKTAS